MPCATALDPLWLSLCGSTGATKRSVCIGFGGGALLNICGLFAGMMYRGIRVVYVPTTFLAMHDVVRPPQTACAMSLFVGRSDVGLPATHCNMPTVVTGHVIEDIHLPPRPQEQRRNFLRTSSVLHRHSILYNAGAPHLHFLWTAAFRTPLHSTGPAALSLSVIPLIPTCPFSPPPPAARAIRHNHVRLRRYRPHDHLAVRERLPL